MYLYMFIYTITWVAIIFYINLLSIPIYTPLFSSLLFSFVVLHYVSYSAPVNETHPVHLQSQNEPRLLAFQLPSFSLVK